MPAQAIQRKPGLKQKSRKWLKHLRLEKGFSDGLQLTNPDSHSDILDFSVKVKDGNRLAGKPASSR